MDNELNELLEKELKKAIIRIGYKLEAEFKKAVPVDTGRLRSSIKVVPAQNNELIVFMAEYWKYVEYGVAPHIIMPKGKKALKFKGKNNKNVIVKKVQHPGTRPNPFVRKTLFTKLNKIITKEISR